MSDSAVDKALFALEHYADWCDGYVPPHRLRETMALLREQARTIARLEGERDDARLSWQVLKDDHSVLDQARDHLESQLRDTEFLYRAYFVLCKEAGICPGSRELMEAADRFSAALEGDTEDE